MQYKEGGIIIPSNPDYHPLYQNAFINVQNIWRTQIKSTDIHAGVELQWGLCDNYWWIWKLLVFAGPSDIPLMFPGYNYRRHTTITEWPLKHALQLKGNVSCMGLLTDRGNSLYEQHSSCRWLETRFDSHFKPPLWSMCFCCLRNLCCPSFQRNVTQFRHLTLFFFYFQSMMWGASACETLN